MHGEESGTRDSSFATETQLAPPVEAWLVGIGSTCIGREVEVGFGVPDLVAGVGSWASLRNRRRQARPVTQSLHLAVLDFCRTPRSEADLREWAPNGYSELSRRALKPLLSGGMLVFRNEVFRARVAPKDPFERIVAVELKLTDGKRGLAQAHAYRAFADLSYLALPAHRITPGLMESARTIGVGLLAVHTGLVEEAVEPDTDSYATAGRRRMASEHTMAAHADGAQRSAGAPRRR
jgi:hypothetical protein